MLDRISSPVALAAVHDACRRHGLRHSSTDYHSLLYSHCLHNLEQEQATYARCQESALHEKYVGVSESKVPYFFATKILHIIRCLFLQLLLTSFTIFSRSHLLC